MTPSREALEFSDKTIAYLKAELRKVQTELAKRVKEEIDGCETKWEARCKAKELHNAFGYYIASNLDFEKWRGQDLPTYGELQVNKKYYKDGTRIRRSNDPTQAVDISANTVVVIKDIDRKFDSRCRHLCNETGRTVWLVIDSEKEIVQRLGCKGVEDIVYHASELDDPPRTKSTRATGVARKTTTTVMEFDPQGSNRSTYGKRYNSRYWVEAELQLHSADTTECVWVDWYNYNISSEDTEINMRELMGALNAMEIDLPPLYGVKTPQRKKISKASNWITLKAWVTAHLEGICNTDAFKLRVAHNSSLSNIQNEREIWQLMENKTIDFLDPEGDFAKLADFVMEYTDCALVGEYRRGSHMVGLAAIRTLAKMIRYDLGLDKVKKEVDGEQLYKKVEEKYPLVLSFLDHTYGDRLRKQADSIVCNINAIDYYLS